MRYLSATRHPWACLLFLLPLLLVYEVGVLTLAGEDPNLLRNGADVWLRWGLERYGLCQPWLPPALLLGWLIVRAWISWKDRPTELLTTLFGMVLESIVYAVGLWTVARNFEMLLTHWGLPLAAISFHTPAAEQVVTYIGAGIYEEVLFRLGLYSLLYYLLRVVLIPLPLAIMLAACGAAVTFAAAHHLGDNGEELLPVLFLFRVIAGLYFTALYVMRGFGIAVGAHAGYDILVGVSVG
jgi:hypothetical protein